MQKVGYKKGSPGITKGQKMGETLDRKREGLINRLPGISKGQFQNTDPYFTHFNGSRNPTNHVVFLTSFQRLNPSNHTAKHHTQTMLLVAQ